MDVTTTILVLVAIVPRPHGVETAPTAATRFEAIAIDTGFRLENSAQGFVATVDSSGVEIVDRDDRSDGSARIRLDLIGFGRGHAWTIGVAREVRADGRRVTLARDGLVEWYVNDARGLEQGFTIERRPDRTSPDLDDGLDDGSRIVLEMRMAGSLAAEIVDGELVFANSEGSVELRFGGLRAFDSDGTDLPATMTIGGERLRITVDDRAARYPIVIDPLAYLPNWSVVDAQAGSNFGESCSSAGDLNGDGYDDVVIGAPLFIDDQFFEGRALAYHGSAAGLATTPAWFADGNQSHSLHGRSVTGLGDFNGDGYDDVAIGAPSSPGFGNGRVSVYFGSPSGLGASPAMVFTSTSANGSFGISCSGGADFDGDGFPDLLVGANKEGDGKVYAFSGGTNPATVAAWSFTASPYQSLGNDLDAAGDVDNDGFGDVIVGAISTSNGQGSEGAALLFRGSATGLAASPSWSAEGDFDLAAFGRAVAGAGDVNGDGYDDVAVSANRFAGAGFNEGIVYAFLGGPNLPGSTPDWARRGEQVNSSFGSAIDGAGDLDGDGFSELLIGASNYYDAPTSFVRGRIFVFSGSSMGLQSIAAWYSAKPPSSFVGTSVSAAGDVNGDGHPDIVGGGANFDAAMQFAVCHHGGPFASIAPYGLGKPLAPNSLPPRLLSSPPILGGQATLDFQGGAPDASPVYLLYGIAPAALPFDGATIHVSPLALLKLPKLNGSGKTSLLVTLPPDPILVGVSVYMQMGYQFFGAPGPYHTVWSNGLRWTFGS